MLTKSESPKSVEQIKCNYKQYLGQNVLIEGEIIRDQIWKRKGQGERVIYGL